MAGNAPLVAVLGRRGCGKSAWVTQELARLKPSRLIVWDLKREYTAAKVHTSDLSEALRAMAGARWSISFHPESGDEKRRAAQFDLFCRGLLAAKNCTAVVEELAFVTRPQVAPPGWRSVCLLGRHDEVTVYGTSQRPASIDKDFLANATLTHSALLNYEEDARTVARTLGVPFAELMALEPLEWLERGEFDAQARRGRINFGRKKAPKPNASGTPP